VKGNMSVQKLEKEEEFITVQVQIFKPFYEFIKAYLDFFALPEWTNGCESGRLGFYFQTWSFQRKLNAKSFQPFSFPSFLLSK